MSLSVSLYTEVFPTIPLILNPFYDQLPVPKALVPLSPAEVAMIRLVDRSVVTI